MRGNSDQLKLPLLPRLLKLYNACVAYAAAALAMVLTRKIRLPLVAR